MSKFDRASYYYSGQGVVMIGDRDAQGKPRGLVPVGNVSALSIAIETDTLEHKESQSGQRATDLRLTTETRCNLTMTMENFIAENLDIALRASVTEKAGGSVTAEAANGYAGKVTPFQNIAVSAVTVTIGVTPLVVFVDDATPWDYKLNAEGGSVLFNDGSVTNFDSLPDEGEATTAVTAASSAVISVADTSTFTVGEKVVVGGITWGTPPTSGVEYGTFVVESIVLNTSITVAWDTTGAVYTSGGFALADGFVLDIDYTYGAQNLVDALTEPATERYMRFEGLNTADGFNAVIVEVFKFLTDPLAELALINDELAQFELAGSALADPLQSTGSQFFKVSMLR